MKILVTGASGFLGQHLCRALLAQGHHVTGLDLSNIPPFQDNKLHWISTDLRTLDSITDRFDAVYHLGALLKPEPKNPCTLMDVNEGGTIRLLKACSGKIDHFIFASSQMVYGDPSSLSVNESHVLNATTSYGTSKLNAENRIIEHSLKDKANYTLLRLTGFIENPDSAIHYFINQALSGMPIELFSKGEICRDYLTREDAIQAFLKCIPTININSPKVRIYNIGSGSALSTHKIASLICKESRSSSVISIIDRPAPRSHFVYDISKARNELGFSPLPLDQAILRHLHNLL